MGEGPRGSNGARSTLHRVSATPSASHNQTGPLWCWLPSGWACARSRPLWVSPTTSPVRLGVSPAAAPTPTGIYNQRFEALFPGARALGYALCFTPLRSFRFICANVGPQGLLVVRLPAPFVPHSASLGPATAMRVLSTPVPVSASPTSLDECLFSIFLVLVPLAVRFSVSSGCARRRSVSTYAAILVLRLEYTIYISTQKPFLQRTSKFSNKVLVLV